MTISNIIISSAYMWNHGFSGVNIFSPNDNLDKVASTFAEDFKIAWAKSLDKAEENTGLPCVNKIENWENPAYIVVYKSRIYINLMPLSIVLDEGTRSDNELGVQALEETLTLLKSKYPEITYEGVVAYDWVDLYTGGTVNYEFSSEALPKGNKKTYDFIERKLNVLFSNEDASDDFWLEMEERLEDAEEDEYRKVLYDFLVYGFDDAAYIVLDIAEEYNPDLWDCLSSMATHYKNEINR